MSITLKSPARRSVLFLLPLLLVFGTPLLILWLGGEFISPDEVIRRQALPGSQVLAGPAYTNRSIYSKYHAVLRRKPRILALGNSRVMEFGAEFFRPDAGFFNGGGGIVKLRHFRAFIEALPPEASPKILIAGLHQPFFNPAFDTMDERGESGAGWLRTQFQNQWDPAGVFTANWRLVYGDLAGGKMKFGRLLQLRGLRDRIGLGAAIQGEGFRADGSFLYRPDDSSNPHPWDADFKVSFSHIDAGDSHYVHGGTVSPAALRELELLLDECHARGIHVIGFLPPFAHAVWAKMMARENDYGYLLQLEGALRPLLESRGGEFYDFSDLATLGADDTEAVDGHHGSDKAYLRIVIAMLKAGSQLAEFANASELEAVLAAHPGNARVFRPLP